MNDQDIFDSFKNNTQSTPQTQPQLPKGQAYGEGYIPNPSSELSARDVSQQDFDAFQKYNVDTRFSQNDWYEQLGQNQSAGEKIWHGAERLVATTLTKTGESLGYAFSALPALFSGDIKVMTDNAWSQTFADWEKSVKDNTPIYTPKSVQEGGLLDKMSSLSFWMDQGVDGAAFFISSLIPGKAFKALGVGAKIAEAVGAGSKLANGIDLGTITVWNTVTESAQEAKGVQDSVRKNLEARVRKGEINPDQAEELAAKAARDTFWWNMGVLAGPEFFQTKSLFGQVAKETKLIGKILDPITGEVIENPTSVLKYNLAKSIAKQAGLGFLREGLWEENIQTAIQHHYENAYSNGIEKNAVADIFNNMLQNTGEFLTGQGTEGATSILLGGVTGMLGGIGAGIRENNQDNYIINKATNLLQGNVKTYRDSLSNKVKDVLEKDDQGNIKLDDNGQPIINKDKVSEVLANIAEAKNITDRKNIALLTGKKDEYDFLSNAEFNRFVLPWLSFEDGLQYVNKQIDNMSEAAMKESVDTENFMNDSGKQVTIQQQKATLKKKASAMYNDLQNVQDKTGIWDFAENKAESKVFAHWLDAYQKDLVAKKTHLDLVREKYNQYNNELNTLTNDLPVMITQDEREQIDNLKNKVEQYKEAFEYLNKEYSKDRSKEGALEKWNKDKGIFTSIKEEEKAKEEPALSNPNVEETVDNKQEEKPTEDKEETSNETKTQEPVKRKMQVRGKGQWLDVQDEVTNEDGEQGYILSDGNWYPKSDLYEPKKQTEQELKENWGGKQTINTTQIDLPFTAEREDNTGIHPKGTIERIRKALQLPNALNNLRVHLTKEVSVNGNKEANQVTNFEGSVSKETAVRGLNQTLDMILELQDENGYFDAMHFVHPDIYKTIDEQSKLKDFKFTTETRQKAKELFHIWDGNDSNGNKILRNLTDADLDQLIKAQENIDNITRVLSDAYASGAEYLSTKQLKDLGIDITVKRGIFDVVNDNNTPDLTELEAANINGEYYIYDRGKNRSSDVESLQLLGSDSNVRTGLKLLQEVSESSLNNFLNSTSTARYIAIGKKNGETFVFPLKRKSLSDNQLTEYLNKAKKDMELANTDEERNAVLDYLKDNIYFDTLPQRLAGDDGNPADISLVIDKKEANKVQLRVSRIIDGKKETKYYPSKGGFSESELSSVDSMVTAINRGTGEFKFPVVVNKDMLIDNTATTAKTKDTPTPELAKKFESTLSKHIFKDQKVIVKYNAGQVNTNIIEDQINIVAPVETTTDNIKDNLNQVKEVEKETSGLNKLELARRERELKKQLEEKLPDATDQDIIKKNIDPDVVGKVSDYISNDELNYEEAKKWIDKTLPPYIQTQQLENSLINIKTKGYTWGAFSDKIIYLSTTAQKGTEAHEAFHAVFRTLLSDTEIQNMYRIARAKYANPTKEDLNKLKEYNKTLSNQQLESLYYEEKMADSFMEYKLKQDKINKFGLLGTMFKRILDFFKWISGNQTELDALFGKINNGNFKNSSIKSNEFTRNVTSATAYKLIPKGYKINEQENKKYTDYHNTIDSDKIVRTFAAKVYKRQLEEFKKEAESRDSGKPYSAKSKQQLIEEQFKVEAYFNDIDNPGVESFLLKDEQNMDNNIDKLNALNFTYSDPTSKKIITEEVNKILDYFNMKDESDTMEELIEQDEDERNHTFDSNAVNIGGIDSMTKAMRAYLGTITYHTQDFLGRDIEEAIDIKSVFTGLQRMLSNTDQEAIMFKFREFAKINPQASAVWNRFSEDTGIDEDLYPSKSKALYRMFINTFQRERINYIQILLKNNKGSIIEANRKSAKFQLYEEWRKNYSSIDKSESKKLAEKVKTIETKLFKGDIQAIQEILKQIGITVKDEYIKYLVLNKRESFTKDEMNFKSAFNDVPIVKAEDWQGIASSLEKGENIFERGSDEVGEESKAGAIGRILKIAEGAMYFDENAFDSNFQDANGETRYSYVKPSVTLETIRNYKELLSTDTGREAFKNKSEKGLDNDFNLSHLQDNYLINHSEADNLFGNLNVYFTGDIRENKQGRDGATFKDIDPRAFKVMQYMLFNDQKKYGKLNTALYYTRVLEAKSTAYAVRLPIEQFYTNNQLTERGQEVLYQQFLSEVKRIRNAQLELENSDKKIVDYHTGKQRGLKFFVFNFLNEEAYINKARQGQDFSDVKDEILKKISDKFEQDINTELQNLKDLQLLSAEDKIYFNTLGVNNNKDYVGNFVLNGFINSNALTDLLERNQAMAKDHVDSVKRAGRMVAAKTNFGKGNHAVVVYEDPMTSSDKILGGDKAWEAEDAQASISLNHFIFINYREGRIDDKALSILYDLNDGIKVSWEDLQYLKEKGVMLNNLKTVTSAPMDYHKMSDRVLTRNLVMYKNSKGEWKVRKGREYLYNLYSSLIKTEQDINEKLADKIASHQRLALEEIDSLTPVRMLPKSGSKLLNLELAKNDNGNIIHSDKNIRYVPNKYSGRQVETPTGKTEITYGTQLIHLIDSEQDEDHIVKLPDGTEKSLGELRKDYEKLLSQARINSIDTLRKYLFKIINGEITEKQEDKFRKKILDSLENTGSDDNLLTFFGLDTKYNPNLPHLVNKYEQMFFAHFSKGGFSQKTAGLKLTLFSGHGTNVIVANEAIKDTNIRKGTVIPSDYYEKLLEEGKITEEQVSERELQYNPTGLSDCIVPLFAKELYNLKVGDTLSHTDLFKLFGQRIPTQDKHSMAALKIVDFLPAEYGSIALMPKELVKLSGADFDIDSLFAMRKDFYTDDNGKLKAYGTAESLEGKWYEYKQYQIAHNKDLKKVLKERLLNNKEYQIVSGKFDKGYEDYNQKEIFDFILNGIDKDRAKTLYNQELLAAMHELQLPSSFEDWKEVSKHGELELNNSTINNQLLDLNMAFLTNKAINDKQVPQTPVDTESLKAVRDEILAQKPKKVTPTLHSPVGQYYYWVSNSTGKQNVGPAANYNIARAFLFKNHIDLDKDTLKITIEDENKKLHELNTFDRVNDITGKRIQDSISTIVSAMTDNAKDPIAGDLHLTPDSLSVMLHWVSLGMDMTTAAKIINQPIVLDFISATQGRNSAIDVSDGKLLSENDIIKSILAKYQATDLRNSKDINLSIEELNNALKEEKPDTNIQAKALASYLNTRDQAKYVANLNKLMGLNKTLKTSSDDNFNVIKAYNTLTKPTANAAFDISKAINKSHIGVNAKLLNQVLQDSKHYLLTNADKITSFTNNITDMVKEFMRNKQDKMAEFKLDLVANLAIQGYRKINQSINPAEITVSEKNLVKQLNDLIINYPILRDNTFIKYLFIENKEGFQVLSSNSRIKLSREQSNLITDSYSELLRSDNPEISAFAFNLFNYVLVKDGGRFVSDSYIKYLLPSVFKPMSDQLTNIHDAILNNKSSDEFNNRLNDIMSNFADMYFAHPDNIKLLEQIKDVKSTNIGNNKTFFTDEGTVFPLYINDNNKAYKLISYYDMKESKSGSPVMSIPNIIDKGRIFSTKAVYAPLIELNNKVYKVFKPTYFKNLNEYYETFKDSKPPVKPTENIEPNLPVDPIQNDKNNLQKEDKTSKLAENKEETNLGDLDNLIKQAKIKKQIEDNKGKKCE